MDVSGHHQTSTDSTQADLVTARNAEAGSAVIAQYQLMITRMFRIAVDILNVARSLESMAFEMQLLARNGVVQAAKVPAGEGKALLALAGILSSYPGTITPEVEGLGVQCKAIARHTAECTNLARRYFQHSKCLLTVLNRQIAHGNAEFMEELASLQLTHPGDLERVLASRMLQQGDPLLRENLLYLGRQCLETLRKIQELLGQSLPFLTLAEDSVGSIKRIGETARYLGLCVGIEAAHLPGQGKTHFANLANGITTTVDGLNQKFQTIRDTIGSGRALLTQLAKGEVDEEHRHL
ncbi:MAG: hypothetical protein H8K08_17580 [Nitrospira sp.]|nr:hypothetical protein [Nitrospira sp.]